MSKFTSLWNAFKGSKAFKKTVNFTTKTTQGAWAMRSGLAILASTGVGLTLGVNAALSNRMRTNLQTTPQRMSPTNYPTDKRIPYNHLGTQGLSLALFNRRHNTLF